MIDTVIHITIAALLLAVVGMTYVLKTLCAVRKQVRPLSETEQLFEDMAKEPRNEQ